MALRAHSNSTNFHLGSTRPLRPAPSTKRAQVTTRASAKDVGIIIVDHGSRRKESNIMLEDFAMMYQERTGRSIVEPAHMELAEPSISTAFDKCVARGAKKIVVSPYFLSRGKHIQSDIPALVSEAAAKHPGVSFVIAEPIGLDPMMASIIDSRVTTASEVAGISLQHTPESGDLLGRIRRGFEALFLGSNAAKSNA